MCLILIIAAVLSHCLSLHPDAHAQERVWHVISDTVHEVTSLAVDRDHVWCATKGGGLVRWNKDGMEFAVITEQEGLPSNTVYNLIQAPDGSLWASFPGGIVGRFDGNEWIFHNKGKSADYWISNMQFGSDGVLWVQSGSMDILSYKDGQWQHFTLPNDEYDSRSIRTFLPLRDGSVLFGMYGRPAFYRLSEGVFIPIDPDFISNRYNTPTHIVETRSGQIFASLFYDYYQGPDGGIAWFDGVNWSLFVTSYRLQHNEMYSLVVDTHDRLFAATRSGVSIFENDHFVPYLNTDESPIRLHATPDGEVWVMSVSKLIRLSDESTRTIGMENGLLASSRRLIAHGPDGDIWLAERGVLTQVGDYSVENFSQGEWIGDPVNDISCTGDGTTWFRESSRLIRYHNGAIEKQPFEIYKMKTGPDGTLWTITTRGELRNYKDSSWTLYTDTSIPTAEAIDFDITDTGVVWIAMNTFGDVVLVSFDGLSWNTHTMPDDDKHTFANRIATDSRGKVWVLTHESVYRFDGTEWYSVDPGIILWDTIARGPDGDIWIGSGYDGTVRYDGVSFTPYPFFAHDMAFIDGDRFWFVNSDGLFYFDGEHVHPVDAGGELVNNDAHTVAVAPDGTIWTSTYGKVLYSEPVTEVERDDTAKPSDCLITFITPNPFNPSTRITVSIPDKRAVSLRVVNILGQSVKTIHRGILPSGGHSFVWDGMDDSGGQAPSGVYIAVLEHASRKSARKMMLVR